MVRIAIRKRETDALEKPESEKLEVLGTVRSSQMRHLAYRCNGVFN